MHKDVKHCFKGTKWPPNLKKLIKSNLSINITKDCSIRRKNSQQLLEHGQKKVTVANSDSTHEVRVGNWVLDLSYTMKDLSRYGWDVFKQSNNQSHPDLMLLTKIPFNYNLAFHGDVLERVPLQSYTLN